MLTRASWMFAQKLSSMNLYASCIAILALCGISIAVQSAGVLTDAPPPRRADDVKVCREQPFPPKGGSSGSYYSVLLDP